MSSSPLANAFEKIVDSASVRAGLTICLDPAKYDTVSGTPRSSSSASPVSFSLDNRQLMFMYPDPVSDSDSSFGAASAVLPILEAEHHSREVAEAFRVFHERIQVLESELSAQAAATRRCMAHVSWLMAFNEGVAAQFGSLVLAASVPPPATGPVPFFEAPKIPDASEGPPPDSTSAGNRVPALKVRVSMLSTGMIDSAALVALLTASTEYHRNTGTLPGDVARYLDANVAKVLRTAAPAIARSSKTTISESPSTTYEWLCLILGYLAAAGPPALSSLKTVPSFFLDCPDAELKPLIISVMVEGVLSAIHDALCASDASTTSCPADLGALVFAILGKFPEVLQTRVNSYCHLTTPVPVGLTYKTLVAGIMHCLADLLSPHNPTLIADLKSFRTPAPSPARVKTSPLPTATPPAGQSGSASPRQPAQSRSTEAPRGSSSSSPSSPKGSPRCCTNCGASHKLRECPEQFCGNMRSGNPCLYGDKCFRKAFHSLKNVTYKWVGPSPPYVYTPSAKP